MRRWLRRLRGAVGMGLTWAAAWFGVGLAVGVVGFQAGAAAFGSGLAWLAYNSLVSAGVVAGVQVGLFMMVMSGTPNFLYYFGIQGLMGAGSATGTLMLARKADGPDHLSDGLAVDEVGLTAEEKRQLLGS